MTIEGRMEFVLHSIESHDRQIGELTEKIDKLSEKIDKLVSVTNEDAHAIRALVRIAESHDRRLSGLEDAQ